MVSYDYLIVTQQLINKCVYGVETNSEVIHATLKIFVFFENHEAGLLVQVEVNRRIHLFKKHHLTTMISLYELQPGSLLFFGSMPAKVCMIDLVDESLMIALENGQHKMIHKETMGELSPMPLSKKAFSFLPNFKKGITSLSMSGRSFFLKAENSAVTLHDEENKPVFQFSNILSIHQLQGLYRLLTGAQMAIAFEHFLQEC